VKNNFISRIQSFFQSSVKKLNARVAIPFEGRFAYVLNSLSDREKQIFFAAMGVLVGTTIILLVAVNASFLVQRPARGGTLIEGVLNTPAHINPLLATGDTGSNADRDLSALIYSGLLRSNGKGGFIPDLAQKYTISPNGLVYTFTLKPNLVWHDGQKITASDVVFTIKTAQDSRIKSAKRANWDGVGVEQIDDLTVQFTLAQTYAPFLENATMGILPEHIWKTVDYNRFDTNKYNREPIGSGPYKFSSLQTTTKDGDEIPVSYTLKAFDSFALGAPHIATIKFLFYHNDDELMSAISSGDVDAINGISPENARVLEEHGSRVLHAPLPRVLAVFFNQSQAPIFADISVRKALALVVDKQSIINKALAGYGVILDSAIPPGAIGYQPATHELSQEDRLTEARALLEKAGWKFSDMTKTWTKKLKKETQTLSFDLSTSEASELKTVAQELKTSWENFGIPVNVRVFATGDLKETVVRPRKFDALFFGQAFGRDGDPYPFWHSSQRLDPGLNIASYANPRVDKILESARIEPSGAKRSVAYKAFHEELAKDSPAVFLYAPEFLYVVPQDVEGLSLKSISTPSERFLNIYEWYTETDNVWKIFTS
jgi:peptide/nickel transport system substrate-binding protein